MNNLIEKISTLNDMILQGKALEALKEKKNFLHP